MFRRSNCTNGSRMPTSAGFHHRTCIRLIGLKSYKGCFGCFPASSLVRLCPLSRPEAKESGCRLRPNVFNLRRSFDMVHLVAAAIAFSFLSLPTDASPLRPVRRQSITTLSTSQIETFKPFTFFASAAYCNPSTTINWSCGGEMLYDSLLGRLSDCLCSLCPSSSPK